MNKEDNIAEIGIVRYNGGELKDVPDIIVREEPLEIFVNDEKKYFCMRMPGMDYELGLGLLYNEGLIDSADDIYSFEQREKGIFYKIKNRITPGVKKIYASSGSMFSDEMLLPVSQSSGSMTGEKLIYLQGEFFKMQKVFEKTGGVHACAFYTPELELISFAEDVGRHNALDKCMGRAAAERMSGRIFLILLSSRISFEMIRKSCRTGAVVVAGVSAPTSAAVNAAVRSEITLVGFLRGERFNIYSHPERLKNHNPAG